MGSMTVRWLLVTTSRWLRGTSFHADSSFVSGSDEITIESI